MLSCSRAFCVSNQSAASRWFGPPRSLASTSTAKGGKAGSQVRSQRAAVQAALDLSRKGWLATLTPPEQLGLHDDDHHQQEEEEAVTVETQEELFTALAEPVVSDVQGGEGPLVVGPGVLVIGIDPDVSGAMAVLRGNDITTAEVFDVPSVRVLVGSQHRNRHDARSIVSMIKNLNAPTGSVAYIEQSIPLPKDGKQGWWGSGFGYGIWIGTLVASGISVVPVPASTWKRAMGLSGKGVTKDHCRACASLIFPSLASQLKRKKDHGRAEALLIAAHGKGIPAPQKDSLAESSLDDIIAQSII
eukprot:c29241_g1_i1 orf=139-1044(+)